MLDEKGMCFLMVNRMTETVRMRQAAKINNLIYISNFKINFIILLNKIDNNYKIFIKLHSALRYTMVLY
jgi:hypothetical protein